MAKEKGGEREREGKRRREGKGREREGGWDGEEFWPPTFKNVPVPLVYLTAFLMRCSVFLLASYLQSQSKSVGLVLVADYGANFWLIAHYMQGGLSLLIHGA
jgi:hypothetical protein